MNLASSSFGFLLIVSRQQRRPVTCSPRGAEIIWDGDVIIPGQGKNEPPFIELIAMNPIKLCNYAINRITGSWESRPTYYPYGAEAKRRDLTPEACKELSPASAIDAPIREPNLPPRLKAHEFASASDFRICSYALDRYWETPRWSRLYEFEPYVWAAEKRGMNPSYVRLPSTIGAGISRRGTHPSPVTETVTSVIAHWGESERKGSCGLPRCRV